MREMRAQCMYKPSRELPQDNSVGRITKHESWVQTVDVHALVSPLRFNREHLLQQGLQGR